jgi:hypothetical protein
MNYQRTLLVSFQLMLLSCAGPPVKPDFSGEWKLNAAKSHLGTLPSAHSMTQKVNHKDPQLQLAVTEAAGRFSFSSNFSYTTDGKECINMIRNMEIKSALKWDGETLVIQSKMIIEANPVVSIEKWTLSEDGKMLTVNRQLSGPQREEETTLVLEKQ